MQLMTLSILLELMAYQIENVLGLELILYCIYLFLFQLTQPQIIDSYLQWQLFRYA